jgi:hypothetical protein
MAQRTLKCEYEAGNAIVHASTVCCSKAGFAVELQEGEECTMLSYEAFRSP